MQFRNLIEVSNYFADATKATEYLIQLRWANGITCVHCGNAKVYELKKAIHRFKCAKCRKQFSATKGSIFENSPISLQKWFTAVYLITSHKKGISSHQLAKDISVTQKSSWFMLQRIRFALESGSFSHSPDAIIQVDETYVGGSQKNRHQSRIAKFKRGQAIEAGIKKNNHGRSLEKTPVVGIIEQGGNVTAKVVPNATRQHLHGFINENVKDGTTIVTDEYQVYNTLRDRYNHISVEHRLGQYTNNGFHTNGIENFWSHFKRGIYGIYHQISPKHMDKYIDEYEFRYNTRKMSERDRFDKMLTLSNKRLTYAELIKKESNKGESQAPATS